MPIEMRPQFQPFLDQLKDQYETASRFIQSYNGQQHSRLEHMFILQLNRATENVGALVYLLEGGYLNDALALMRSLTDIYIDVRYIRTDRANLLQRFYDYAIVSGRWKKELVTTTYGITVEDQLRTEYTQHRDALRDDITSADEYIAAWQLAVDQAQQRWSFRQSGWAQLDTFAKATRVRTSGADPDGETENVYRLVYRMTSEALHSGIGGALRGVSVEGTTATLEHRPRELGDAALLVLAWSAFLHMKVMDYVNAELSLGLESELTRLDGTHAATLRGGGVADPPDIDTPAGDRDDA